MEINYTIDAFASLTSLVNFIEENNTLGAGVRWLEKFEAFLKKALVTAKRKRFCHNATFNRFKLRCIYYNDWVIAFSVHKDFILIEALLHRSRIKD